MTDPATPLSLLKRLGPPYYKLLRVLVFHIVLFALSGVPLNTARTLVDVIHSWHNLFLSNTLTEYF